MTASDQFVFALYRIRRATTALKVLAYLDTLMLGAGSAVFLAGFTTGVFDSAEWDDRRWVVLDVCAWCVGILVWCLVAGWIHHRNRAVLIQKTTVRARAENRPDVIALIDEQLKEFP